MGEDRELNAVLICLAPLAERGLQYVDISKRQFSYQDMLESQGWSSGERQLIIAAGALWNEADNLDLSYIACGLSDLFFIAVANALAARRGHDFRTDYHEALETALGS